MKHTNDTKANPPQPPHLKKHFTEFKIDDYFMPKFPLFYKTVCNLSSTECLPSLQQCNVFETGNFLQCRQLTSIFLFKQKVNLSFTHIWQWLLRKYFWVSVLTCFKVTADSEIHYPITALSNREFMITVLVMLQMIKPCLCLSRVTSNQ